jgi:hypothetical protein
MASDSDDDDDELFVVLLLPLLFNLDEPVIQHDSCCTGNMYYRELMNTANTTRFREAARMDKPCFLSFLELLVANDNLQGSSFIEAGEKLMIYLTVLSGSPYGKTCERWQHSKSTVSIIIHEVSDSILLLRDRLFIPVDFESPYIRSNPKFSPFFNDCIGAFDGSHIPAVPPD